MQGKASLRPLAADVTELVGNTPLVRLGKLASLAGMSNFEILGKAEFMNPSGSLKDRILLKIIKEAIRSGKLRKGMTILESTTGNTGIATSMMGARLGFPVIIVMPEGMSEERKKAIRAFGAEILTVPGAESDVDLAVSKTKEMVKQNPGKYFLVDQFNNPANTQAHYETTGPEIWEQTSGKIDAFVATAGTGGTISGIGRYLKEKDPKIKMYVVEPESCPVLAKQRWGTHPIEGIGDGFIPTCLDLEILDGVILVNSEKSIEMTKRLAREEGLFVGISSGANVEACFKLHKRHPKFNRVVTMINDHGFRYFSTMLFGQSKVVKVPDRPHPIDITPKQRSLLAKLDVIE